ncbi:MAG: hypothetical protein U5K32_07615 [Bacteroidales bacterium]|nr:hypothetical protein [Bacteroidales bacterium]
MRETVLFICIIAISASIYAQEGINKEGANQSDSLRKDALNVYMDASSYLKENIPFINYVRDRKFADLIIISTSQSNASGGREYYMFLEGQGKYEGMDDTLTYSSSPDETYEQRRDKEVKTLKMGLMRYVLKTPLAEHMNISFSQAISSEVTTDNWNNWVFSARISGFMHGQSSYSNYNTYGSVSANKITEDWKVELDLRYSYSKDEFEINEDLYESVRTTRSASALIVKSVGDHWSYGGSADISSSTYSNYDLNVNFMPGIEFNVFPYSESTRRQFRFLYSIGYMYNDYADTTIYEKTEEGLFAHSLRGAFEVIQKWGRINLSASWSNYLRDFSENQLSINGNISWRVAKGLSINMGGSYSFIRNQIALVKGGATSEEILLRQRELQTNYRYFVNFGLSYTFGSIYSNVVNPRFGGSSGGGIVIMH